MLTVKKYEDLTFTDDFMFCKVLTEHPDICAGLAELFTGWKVREIRILNTQLTIQYLKNGHGVRFDVYFEDDDAVYDFEMQTSSGKDLPKRTRYYQSQMDARHLRSGRNYRELPDSYVIFICTEDPFRVGLGQYTFHNVCMEHAGLFLNDGSAKIFINAQGIAGKGLQKLKPFPDYLNGQVASDPLTREIASAVESACADEEGREMYMTLLERDEEMRTYGRNTMIYSLVQDGELSPEKGAARLHITPDELKAAMADNGYKWPSGK